jgi:hypothetical protein
MKTLAIVLGACLCLVGCTANTDSSESEDTHPAESSSGSGEYGWGHGGDEGFGCNQISFIHVTVDGHAYWVQVPTLCDPNPYIYKGDPGPDEGDPYEDEMNRSQIVEKLYAKLAATGGTHSAPHQ